MINIHTDYNRDGGPGAPFLAHWEVELDSKFGECGFTLSRQYALEFGLGQDFKKQLVKEAKVALKKIGFTPSEIKNMKVEVLGDFAPRE